MLPLVAVGQSARVEGVRVWEAPDNVRIVFDVSGPIEHSVFKLDGPDRIVVDITDAVARNLPATGINGGLVRNVRTGVRNGTDVRVVLDLSGPAQPRSFLLRPNDRYGHRLVIDLAPAQAQVRQAAVTRSAPTALRDLVIAIDAGHGGEDPGAVGPSGLHEKEVTLQIARRLARLVEAEYGMQAVLTRTGDYYVDRSERINRARAARADLFVSIHADAFTDPRAHGSSVYTLSERGATSEAARLLAERENAADLIGGVRLNDKDDMLASVLLDLSQTGVIGASRTVGAAVLEQLHQVGRVHKREVQAANFLVLKAPDVPSILVETAFISNPTEEGRLRDANHQQVLAQAVMGGIRAYFTDHAPPTTLVAVNGIGGGQRGGVPHVIARGETLSHIARRYNVSIQQLRSSNNIASDRIRVGDTLLIPSA
ncbi:MAG: N-acetylmuramoyl-L-alanine amidase [Xanthomonadaceae bacterium]|nr:N-acetylmuramoyl-L-alanine amidase [Xanthomonadaceae bacterium]